MVTSMTQPSDVPQQLTAWQGADTQSKLSVINNLGDGGGPRAVGALIDALCDQEKSVRIAAARALGKLQDMKAYSELEARLLLGDDSDVCDEAVCAMAQLRYF